MKVVLISPYSQIQAIGLRILSACLKRDGFDTHMIFLPDLPEVLAEVDFAERRLSAHALDQIVELCADAKLVGISVMTPSVLLARQVTAALKAALDVTVIWGGIHPTVRPEECLRDADLVCIGEGERALVELARRTANGQSCLDINNLAYLAGDGNLIRNPLYPLEQDLDTLPNPDYDYEHHHVLHQGSIVPFSLNVMYYYLTDAGSWIFGPRYDAIAARGCPYRCTYCANNALAQTYPTWGRLRRRSAENVVAEIKAVRACLPALAGVTIHDDSFMTNPEPYIAAFSQSYREEIGLPFRVYATPDAVDPAKLEHLISAGLQVPMMGIQTGSPRIQKLFRRPASNERILRAARVIHSFRHRVRPPRYDLITDNPYETAQDRYETLRLIHRLPRPYRLSLYALTFYPGTELYRQARTDRLITDDEGLVYTRNFQQLDASYYNLALMCHGWNVPQPILYVITRRPVFHLLSSRLMSRLCGWLLRCLLAVRSSRNRRLYRRYEARYLTEHQARDEQPSTRPVGER